MGSIKFAPISSEKQIPGTNYTIQIGVIQNETRSWGVKIALNGKVVTAKRIKKLIDVEIVGIIRDTVAKKVPLDTFELGTTMSNLLREVYEKLKSRKKSAQPQRPAQQPTPATTQTTTIAQSTAPRPTQPVAQSPLEPASLAAEIKVPSSQPLVSGKADDFWSSYSSLDTASVSYTESQISTQQPASVPAPAPQPSPPPAPAASSDLDDALTILGIACPKCGKEVDPDLEVCPYCGQKL